MDTAESLFPSIELSVREGQKLQFGTFAEFKQFEIASI